MGRLLVLGPQRNRRALHLAGLWGIPSHPFAAWLARQRCFEWAAPDAGAICYAKYDLPIASLPLAERLRDEESVLIVPGAHFGMEGYVRIGFGNDRPTLEDGLARISRFIARLTR